MPWLSRSLPHCVLINSWDLVIGSCVQRVCAHRAASELHARVLADLPFAEQGCQWTSRVHHRGLEW